MKLISLYVENFGGLHRFSLNFEAGLTNLEQPNGFGKTTLAEFIRAMFYGFPRKGKTLEKSRRQKYAPWNGGSFGGNLVFELDGCRYRIERTFGAMPKADTFALIDLRTERKTSGFTEDIGTELFGVDAESFERSIYLPQVQEEGPLATASIRAKLTNLVEGDPDVANFDRAMASLKAKRSALIPYRGSGGAAAEAAQQITRLQIRLDQVLLQQQERTALENAAAQTEAELENVKAELDCVGEELAATLETAAAALHQRRYQSVRQHREEATARLESLRQRYPAGMPEETRLEDAEKLADRVAALEAGIPESYRKSCRNPEELQAQLRMLEKSAAQLDAERQKQGPQQRYIPQLLCGIVGAAAGVAALCAGAVFLLSELIIWGAVASASGAAVLAVGIWLLAARHKKRILQQREQHIRHSALSGKLAAVDRETEILRQAAQLVGKIRECREELDAFFESCAAVPEQDARAQLRRIREDIRNAAAAARLQQELTEEIQEMEAACGDALRAKLPDGEALPRLRQQQRELRQKLSELENRLARQKQQVKLLCGYTEEIPQLREDLDIWQQKREKCLENVRILDETVDYLQQARERLSLAYLDTVRDRFGYYLSQMMGGEESYFVDAEFRVQLERMGRSREIAYFSAGEAGLVQLCMRLALVDAMYSNREMFVILDDPFVDLDDAHLDRAGKLLSELSRQRQILYLTCHSSRVMGKKK